MKKITLCALAVMSINAYANYSETRSYEYNTGDALGSGEVTFEETKPIDEKELAEFREKMKNADPNDKTQVFKEEIEKKNSIKSEFHYFTTVGTQDYDIRPGTTLPVRSYHTVRLWNPRAGTMQYHVNFNLCVNRTLCHNYPFDVKLESGQEYRKAYTSQIITQFHSIGMYPIQGVSNVSGWDGGTGIDNKVVNVTP